MKDSGDGLRGLEAIAGYTGYCAHVVRGLIRDKGFPAAKIGGAWESSRLLIDNWRRRLIEGTGGHLGADGDRAGTKVEVGS